MIFIAMRYLLERKRQTLLTLLGVFFGTMAYVGVSGFFVGFQGFMVQQLVNNAAQVHIEARKDYLSEHVLDVPFFGDETSSTPFGPLRPPESRASRKFKARRNGTNACRQIREWRLIPRSCPRRRSLRWDRTQSEPPSSAAIRSNKSRSRRSRII